MIIEKRVIVVQILMYIMFFLWSISLLLGIKYLDDWITYARFGVFIVILILIYTYYKKGDKKLITIEYNNNKTNRILMYIFVTIYLLQIVLSSFIQTQVNLITIISVILMVAVSSFGAVYNVLILRKNKD